MRRGWVWPMRARPNSRQILGSCVLLPEPVSPATTTTWWSRIVSSSSSWRAEMGSSAGYVGEIGVVDAAMEPVKDANQARDSRR